jgi:transcriptional regulator with XRE-family HTH domain
MEPFGELLREKRKARGLTQQELAERASTKTKVHHSYISAIERGTDPPPTREVVLALLDGLEITDKVERATFLLAAESAGFKDLEEIAAAQTTQSLNHKQTIQLPFGEVGALYFPRSRRMIEREQLLKELEELLNFVESSKEKQEETTKLLQSFLKWLQLHARGEV